MELHLGLLKVFVRKYLVALSSTIEQWLVKAIAQVDTPFRLDCTQITGTMRELRHAESLLHSSLAFFW